MAHCFLHNRRKIFMRFKCADMSDRDGLNLEMPYTYDNDQGFIKTKIVRNRYIII